MSMVIRRVSHILFVLLILLVFVFLPLLVILSGSSSTYASIDSAESTSVAIVFGAGLTSNNLPSDALMDRLTVAADLYARGLVDSLLVSGDNRTQDYNEPNVMKQTLMSNFDVPAEVIFADYAG